MAGDVFFQTHSATLPSDRSCFVAVREAQPGVCDTWLSLQLVLLLLAAGQKYHSVVLRPQQPVTDTCIFTAYRTAHGRWATQHAPQSFNSLRPKTAISHPMIPL